MESHIKKLCEEYLEAAETIRKSELMSVMDLIRALEMNYITLKRIQKDPSRCSLKTLRKLKKFVDAFNGRQYE